MKKWCFVKSDLPPQEKLLGLFGFYHVKASLCPLKYAKLPSHQEVRRRVARVVWVDEKRPDDGKEPTAMRCGPVSWFLKTIFLDGGFSVEILGAFFFLGWVTIKGEEKKKGGSRVGQVTEGFHPAVLGTYV